MKKYFLDSSINLIKKNKSYSDEEIEIIAYGLEGIYLSVTKAIVIFGIAFFLGIIKEVFYLLITYNVIRSQAFGIHASKSIYCLISSLITFIGGAYLCIYLVTPLWLMISISIICVIFLILYAPADTEKRPILKRRKIYKILTISISLIYLIIVIISNNTYIKNLLFFSILIETILVLPITYKLLGVKYNNYKRYMRKEDKK